MKANRGPKPRGERKMIDLRNEPCDCKTVCAAGVENMADCINKKEDAFVALCSVCNSHTWWSNDKCQRCEWKNGS